MSNSNQNESLPPLEDCINAIKSVGFDRYSHSSKQLAKLFTSCIGLISHLDQDRQYIDSKSWATLPISELPAISSILTDKELFKVFLNMLSSRPLETEFSSHNKAKGESASMGNMKLNAKAVPVQSTPLQNLITKKQQQQFISNNYRKRALSTSSTEDAIHLTPNKTMKLMKSPMQQGKEFSKISTSNGPGPVLPSLGGDSHSSLDINFAVLAAVIFFSVLQYLDQWPAIFVRLFAEDKFGAQMWVNDKRCDLFVQNLTTVLQEPCKEIDGTNTDLFVKQFELFVSDDETCTPEMSPHQPAHLENQVGIGNGAHQADDVSACSESTTGRNPLASGHTPKPNGNLTTPRPKGDDYSSSSGEEESDDEVMMSMSSSGLNGNKRGSKTRSEQPPETELNMSTVSSHSSQIADEKLRDNVSPIPSLSSQDLEAGRWWALDKVETAWVCNRFSGANRILAHEMIASSLSNRLSEKVKQNSSLLTNLPGFTIVPQVRALVASQLEKWLQSPALSGLARKLFSRLVGALENIDPPRPEDVSAIKSILSMSLKANQFIVHVDNVIEIVRRVPTLAVCQQIVLHLLTEELNISEENNAIPSNEKSDKLEMLKAVLLAISPTLGHNAVASSLLKLLHNTGSEIDKQWPRTLSLCNLLRTVIPTVLKKWYDGRLMLKFLLADRSSSSDTRLDTIARVVFECVLLTIPKSLIDTESDRSDNLNQVREMLARTLLDMKKLILGWFLRCFKVHDKIKENQFKTRKPNAPAFESILDSEAKDDPLDPNVRILYCILFLMPSNSFDFFRFLHPSFEKNIDECSLISDETKALSSICIRYGHDIDGEMLRMIIKSARKRNGNIGHVTAIALIERLLFNCREGAGGSILSADAEIIWDMYALAEHTLEDQNNDEEIPRLGCPGLWWRVTAISLVLSGKAPREIGAEMWREHPTLRALMKMTVSRKFLFPTVDCDNESRAKMKMDDIDMADQEFEIVKKLFQSPDMNTSKSMQEPTIKAETSGRKGTRTSARQRAKQERIDLIEREKEIARQQAEKLRIKLVLKEAQESIMLLDPRSAARKPPKKSEKLLCSVSNLFGLAKSLIQSDAPDYIIDTIGSTNRDSIERAYDWLIPVISSFPSVINRLPSSASCFLLLRAYGEEGSSTSTLLELASPLLTHVQKSLIGEHGAEGAKRAADLLFFDIADKDPDRRYCARRVLLEALGKVDISRNDHPRALMGEFRWLLGLLGTKHSDVIVRSAIPRLTSALFLERGSIIYAFIHALQYYEQINAIRGAEEEEVPIDESFPCTLFKLLSSRPHACSAAMDRYPDLSALLLRSVHNGFEHVFSNGHADGIRDEDVIISLRKTEDDATCEVHISSSLLKAAVVLLSNWHTEATTVAETEFKSLSRLLFRVDSNISLCEGMASAIYSDSGQRAVSAEDWGSLAKSRCAIVARDSLRCAPHNFLPRLLLCCGLPEHAFSLIINRLENIGNNLEEKDKNFSQLLAPSNVNEWGVGYNNLKRTVIARKLHGRIKACLHSRKEPQRSSSFCMWLANQCHAARNTKVTIKKFSKNKSTVSIENLMIKVVQDAETVGPTSPLKTDSGSNTLPSLSEQSSLYSQLPRPKIEINKQIHEYFNANDLHGLETFLEDFHAAYQTRFEFEKNNDDRRHLEVANELMALLHAPNDISEDFHIMILRWVPMLTQGADSAIYKLLFMGSREFSDEVKRTKRLLVSRCLTNWSLKELNLCQAWAIEELCGDMVSIYCCRSLVMLFLRRSSFCMFGSTFTVSNSTGLQFPKCPIEIEHAGHLTKLAVLNAVECIKDPGYFHRSWKAEDWMILLLFIANQSKEHLGVIVSTLVSHQHKSSEWSDEILHRTLLTLYATFPETMVMSDSNIREILVRASIKFHSDWMEWTNPLDDQIKSTIQNLGIMTLQAQQQLVVALIKKYPLFVIKHIGGLVNVLKNDAVAKSKHDVERSRQYINYPSLVAATGTNVSQVKVMHWGCSFSEPLWVAALDILQSFPEKVLFNCGHLMGLLDILNLYLLLFKIQIVVGNFRSRELTEVQTINRTKNKLSTLLKAFNMSNGEAFASWVTDTKISSQKVSDLLILCAIHIV